MPLRQQVQSSNALRASSCDDVESGQMTSKDGCTCRLRKSASRKSLSITWKRRETYIMKRIGPRQLPCGTPEERSNGLDVDMWMTSCCFPSVRKDILHWRAVSRNPKSFSSMFFMVTWLIVSHAALKSTTTSSVTFCIFIRYHTSK